MLLPLLLLLLTRRTDMPLPLSSFVNRSPARSFAHSQ